MNASSLEPELLHRLKNLLAISLGFGDLLLDEMPEDDPRRADLLAMQQATRDALALMPEIAERLR